MSDPSKPVPQSDTDLWKNFVVKLGDVLTQGQGVGSDVKIYVPPFNSQAIPAGDVVDNRITNFAVFGAGNTLLPEDSPLSAGAIQKLAQNETAAKRAVADYWTTWGEANKIFTSLGGVPAVGKSLEAWALSNYPTLSSTQDKMNSTNQTYLQSMGDVYGPNAPQLGKDKQKLDGALMTTQTAYNMAVSADPAATTTTNKKHIHNSGFRALYNIDSAYTSTVQDWINTSLDPNKPGWSLTFSNKSTSQDWSKAGFSKVDVNASDRWWFFSADYKSENEEKHDKIDTSNVSDEISCTLSAQKVSSFAISPDQSWDLGNIKSAYPDLKPGYPPALMTPMYRPASILVGYQVKLKVSMPKSLYDSVNETYKKAVSNSGSVNFLGISISSASSDASSNTDFSSVVTNDQAYSFEIPASNNTFPVLLGVLGRKTGGT